ncbi:MAG: hypothetical protein V4591_09550 [Bdellovibrionota bacterium]
MMEKYFDAFIYVTNWGTYQLMLRCPLKSLDNKILSAYCCNESLNYKKIEEHFILSFDLNSEVDEDWSWDESIEEITLSSFLPIRSDLINGDYRSLYLGWLACVQADEIDRDTIEPPVPAGLQELTPALESLVNFLHISDELLGVAAQESSSKKETSQEVEIRNLISTFSHSERDDLLIEFFFNRESIYEHPLVQKMKKKLNQNFLTENSKRTVGDLLDMAQNFSRKNKKQKTQEKVW